MNEEHDIRTGDYTIILHPVSKREQPGQNKRLVSERLEEAEGLALAINLEVKRSEVVPINRIQPGTYIGTGKVEEFAEYIKANEVVLAIVDTSLSPVQQRNLEKAWDCKVIDRTALILEIFGNRARTKEGRLQVELAALEYQKSRLVRSWTHLERQRGGFGFVGGPGETQIEADRRDISDRILKIKQQLETVVQTRELHRKSRKETDYPIVALVGYTNAGKSTLFNRLTGADVLAEDKLFATLDPAMRAITLPSGRTVILSDTVGFVSSLPTELIASFRATLEEVTGANLILHVRDISHPNTEAQKDDVHEVLNNLKLQEKLANDTIEVLNKIDLLQGEDADFIWKTAKKTQNCAIISALTGKDCDFLLELIDNKLNEGNKSISVSFPVSDGKTLAWLYKNAQILERLDDEEQIHLKLSLTPKHHAQLLHMQSVTVTG